MDITWHGASTVRIRSRDAAMVMDPCDRSTGYDMKRPEAEIVTVSRKGSPRANNAAGVKGVRIVLDGPGEYEISGVQIEGFRTLHPVHAGTNGAREGEPEPATVFMFETEELRGAHLGGLAGEPRGDLAEELSNLDVLVVPITEVDGLAPQDAAKIVRNLEPAVVIPVGYDLPADGDSPELAAFVKAMGLEPEEPVQRLTLTRRGLGGDGARIVLIESRG